MLLNALFQCREGLIGPPLKNVMLGTLENMVFFRLHAARKHQKNFFTTKSIKIQEFFWMKKLNVNHGL
jgi:hypothetical protein